MGLRPSGAKPGGTRGREGDVCLFDRYAESNRIDPRAGSVEHAMPTKKKKRSSSSRISLSLTAFADPRLFRKVSLLVLCETASEFKRVSKQRMINFGRTGRLCETSLTDFPGRLLPNRCEIQESRRRRDGQRPIVPFDDDSGRVSQWSLVMSVRSFVRSVLSPRDRRDSRLCDLAGWKVLGQVASEGAGIKVNTPFYVRHRPSWGLPDVGFVMARRSCLLSYRHVRP